jgi:hypothetical protein
MERTREMNQQIKERIEKGASVLDEKIPTWIDKQDLLWLNLMSPCMCVLGQAEEIGEYWETLSKLFPGKTEEELNTLAYEHGFNIQLPTCRDLSEKEYQDYTDLTNAWKIFIAERRRALGKVQYLSEV